MHTKPSNRFSAGSLVQANSANGVALFTGYGLKPGEVRTCRVTIANPGATSIRVRLIEAAATSDFDAGSMTLTIQEVSYGRSVTVYQGDIGGVSAEGVDLGYFEPGEERAYFFTAGLSGDALQLDWSSGAGAVYEWESAHSPAGWAPR
jgi:hypothetical protein